MLRKFYFFLLIGLLSTIFCFTHTFAAEDGDAIDIAEIIAEGDFDFPTADGPAYVQGNAEYQKTPDVVIGDPDFEKMRDLPPDSQDYILGTKVGMLFIRNREGEGFVCTGFLVGPDLFLTNHHCVHDEASLRPLATAAIFMDYYQESADDSRLGGVTARVSALVKADARLDYALLRLDRPIGDTYGYLELDTTTVPDASQSVKIIQHPQGRSKEIVRRNSQIFNPPVGHPLWNVPYALSYLADTEAGSSGSPVFLLDGTGVIAIHHSGFTSRVTGPFNNSGSLMSHIEPEIRQYLPVVEVEAPSVYWIDSSTDKIQGAARDGSNVQDIVTTGLRTPAGITVDTTNGKVYWIDSGTDKIQRADLGGNNIEDIVTTGLRTPTGIAVDTTDSKVYWIDSGTDKIQRANLDGSNIEDVVTTGLSTPKGIAVDLKWSKVYWIDATTDKIQRADLDGSNIEDVVTTGLRTPTGIAVDVVNDKVYWVDSGTDKIQRANLDGSNIEDIITTGLRNPTGIALDYTEDSKVYWIDASTDKIQRAALDGSNIEDVVTTGLRTPTGIALGIAQDVPTRPPGPGPGPTPDPVAADVNGDGQVTVVDLAIVALFYGTQVAAGVDLAADVNDDGTVDLTDLTLVAQAIDAAGTNSALSADDVQAVLEAIEDIEGIAEAPARFSRGNWVTRFPLRAGVAYHNVAAAFADAKHLATEDARLGKWMPMLKELLHLLTEMREIPDTTALLPNYPNPFNPETWIPYDLSKPADVTLTIYAANGQVVRVLALGHQVAGRYQRRSRAAYWDGRNASSEPVASGVYFYTLTAGEFTATRKLLIVK